MEFTAAQIAGILEGEIQGNPNTKVSKLSKIEEGGPGALTFLANKKYTDFIYETQASITIVNKSFVAEKEISTTLIRVDDAQIAFAKLLSFYNEVKYNKVGVEQPSFKSESAKHGKNVYLGAFSYLGDNVILGDNVKIYPHVYIGDNVTIDDNTTIFSGAKLYSETVVGKNCVINSGAIIGADGFGFAPNENGELQKIPQIGNVILEDNVDIGAAATLDRATLGSTIIRKGVKIDNQVQIAHNVEIDEHTVIAAQTGIAGSTKMGKHCMIGGQVGIAGHLTLGDHLKVQAQSGIGHRAKDGEKLYGSPAIDYGNYVKSYVHFKNLPNIVKQLNQLEKKVNNNE